jgi:hypothetical protein
MIRLQAATETTMKADRPQPLAIPRKEVARILGLSLSTVDRAIGRGDLKAKNTAPVCWCRSARLRASQAPIKPRPREMRGRVVSRQAASRIALSEGSGSQ